MDLNIQHKRNRKDRNSTELLIDTCLSQLLRPYIHIPDSSLFNGGGVPADFARSTANALHFLKKKQKINTMLAECSPDELLAVFNMTNNMTK